MRLRRKQFKIGDKAYLVDEDSDVIKCTIADVSRDSCVVMCHGTNDYIAVSNSEIFYDEQLALVLAITRQENIVERERKRLKKLKVRMNKLS